MTRRAIEYVGCGLSGRRTSIRQALRHMDLVLDSGDDVRCVSWAGRQLSLGLSRSRAHAVYDIQRWPDLPPGITREIERLCAADGIVFVLDSQADCWERNVEALEALVADLGVVGRSLDEVPVVFQVNKRDVPGNWGVEAFLEGFSSKRCRHVESVATQGLGVLEALSAVMSLVEM